MSQTLSNKAIIADGSINIRAETEADRKLRVLIEMLDLEDNMYLVHDEDTKEVRCLHFTEAFELYYNATYSGQKIYLQKANKSAKVLFGSKR